MPTTELIFFKELDGTVPVIEFLEGLPARVQARADQKNTAPRKRKQNMAKNIKSQRKLTVDDLIEQHSKNKPKFKQMVQEDQERMVIAQQIYDLRHEAGLTQAELAKRIGTSTSVISRLEDSDYERHSMSLLRRVAAAFGKRVQVRFVDDTNYGADIFCKSTS